MSTFPARSGDPRSPSYDAGHCRACGQFCEAGRPDACLGYLPGVSHACCGHGVADRAYVVIGGAPDQPCPEFRSLSLYEIAALKFFDLVKQGEIRDAERAA